MLEETSKYDYLGNPEYFLDLMQLLKRSSERWGYEELRKYFSNRIYDVYPYIDGGIPFMVALNLIILKNSSFELNISDKNVPNTPDEASELVAQRTISTLMDSGELNKLLSPSAISVGSDKEVVISPQGFQLKYRALRRLLLDTGLIHRDKTSSGYVVNPPYDKLITDSLSDLTGKKAISINQLKANLLRQERLGIEAEKFVLEYELKRLSGHPNKEKISQVSEINVAAGYDILSFDNEESKESDRCIEVKSYSGSINFYWTQNEIEAAKTYRKRYFLYLVDRNRIADEGYEPVVIQDPFTSVYSSDEWLKTPTVLFVNKID